MEESADSAMKMYRRHAGKWVKNILKPAVEFMYIESAKFWATKPKREAACGGGSKDHLESV